MRSMTILWAKVVRAWRLLLKCQTEPAQPAQHQAEQQETRSDPDRGLGEHGGKLSKARRGTPGQRRSTDTEHNRPLLKPSEIGTSAVGLWQTCVLCFVLSSLVMGRARQFRLARSRRGPRFRRGSHRCCRPTTGSPETVVPDRRWNPLLLSRPVPTSYATK